MITTLNKTQLAFLLDLKLVDARKKMISAYCTWKRFDPKVEYVTNPKTGTVKMHELVEYPVEMDIKMLAEYLNLPTLQAMVDDITYNYMKRSATKKYILSDFPEQEINKMKSEGKNKKINIPPALKSMLLPETVKEIEIEWYKRYKHLRLDAA